MHNPPHPGDVLADTVVRKSGGLSVTEFARRLGISQTALSRVVRGRAAVSAELAVRLAAALGGSPECWLSMQSAYDSRLSLEKIPDAPRGSNANYLADLDPQQPLASVC